LLSFLLLGLVRPEIIIVDFWSEIKSLTSSPPKRFPLAMAPSGTRYTIRPSEERLLAFLAQQIDGGMWMQGRKVAREIRHRIDGRLKSEQAVPDKRRCVETSIRIFLPILISMHIFINNKSVSEEGMDQKRSRSQKRKNDRVTSEIRPGNFSLTDRGLGGEDRDIVAHEGKQG
jgi:hypothetical protein